MRYNTTNLKICTDINGHKSFQYNDNTSNKLTDILTSLPVLQRPPPHQVTPQPSSTTTTTASVKHALTTTTTTTTKPSHKHTRHINATVALATTALMPNSNTIWWYTHITELLIGIAVTSMSVHIGKKLWQYIERRINTHRFPHMPLINPRQECPQCKSTTSLVSLDGDDDNNSTRNEPAAPSSNTPPPNVHEEAANALGQQGQARFQITPLPSPPSPSPPPLPPKPKKAPEQKKK